MTVICFIGPPGCGKGTQAKMLVNSFESAVHISTGDLLRKNNVETGTGALNSDKGVWGLLLSELTDFMETRPLSGIAILDGFPRTATQYGLIKKFCEENAVNLYGILMEVPTEILQERIKNRKLQENRADDDLEIFYRRMYTYELETKPVCNYFESEGTLFVVDASMDVDAVNKNLLAILMAV